MVELQVTQAEPGGRARCGLLTTPHGAVRTPAFMPVGTRATVKGVWPTQVRDSGADILLANTYHLALRPGPELIAELGGLHVFMAWDGPILTDSGGFQVFSLSDLNQVTDDGVIFRSHLDGQLVHLNPAEAMRIQYALGADIIMAFDECPPGDADRSVVGRAVDRTVRWAAECQRMLAHLNEVNTSRKPAQALFGIIQGGVFPDIRLNCADKLIELNFAGYAVGGLSVGETHEQMVTILDELVWQLPAQKPRYLMGVGMPRDILAAVRSGIDMFDCVLPTRNGRRGYAFTATGPLRLRNEKYRRQEGPIEAGCPCPACHGFSRAYIRHLFMVDEMLGPMLLSIHNLWFFQRFMARLRDLIPTGGWTTMLAEFPIAAPPGGESSVVCE